MSDGDCEFPFISKRERNKILGLLGNMDVCDEDSVWDVAIELEYFSVMLRSNVLSRVEDD